MDPANLATGTVFHGRYQVQRCIKAGGMGAVYEVVHLETRRRRALKVMLPSLVANDAMRSRFKLEATVAADVESEHIVETFDAGVDPGTGAPFLVMELLRGSDLAAVADNRALPPAVVVTYLTQAAHALDRTHAAGIVHRDLKPENLFLTTRDDGSPRVKVLDFGIAKVVSMSAQTAKQTATIGTPLYMSPEQVAGDGNIGPASDLYSLAHIAYTLLTGEAYWVQEAREAGNLYGILMKVVEGIKEPPTARAARRGVTLPYAFDAWFARATRGVPSARFSRAGEQVAALADALGVSPSRPSVPSSLPEAPAVYAGAAASPAATPPQPWRGASAGVAHGHGRTTAPVESEAIPPPPKRPLATALVAGIALTGGAIALVIALFRPSGEPASAPEATNAAPAVEVSAATTAAAPPTPEPASDPAPAPAPSAAEQPTSQPAPSASATVTAAPAPAGTPGPKPKAGTPKAPAAAPKCSPPYYVDADGIRHIKPECK